MLDSELNEQQNIINLERCKLADMLFNEGAILAGLKVTVTDNVLTLNRGIVCIEGHIEQVTGDNLSLDASRLLLQTMSI